MSVPKETVWTAEPHTLAKHAILQEYLKAWFIILGATQGRVLYIDGFSGPGEYKGGQPGSPIIALRAAAIHHRKFKGEVVFHFIDSDPDRVAHLSEKLKDFGRLSKFVITTECDEFESVLTGILNELENEEAQIAPTFAFIDPFGHKGLPMDLIHRLLAHEKTEAFINFNLNTVNRFVEHPNTEIQQQIVELFGTEEVLSVINNSTDRYASLRSLYQAKLGQAAKYVRFFSMHDLENRPIYDLFFAGNHPLGHYRMKQAMWRVDPEHGLRFSDATDSDQALLFDSDPSPDVLKKVVHRYENREYVEVGEIIEWIRDETAYLELHMRAAMKRGEGKQFGVSKLKSDGSKRRKNSFTPETILDFTWQPPPKQGELFST